MIQNLNAFVREYIWTPGVSASESNYDDYLACINGAGNIAEVWTLTVGTGTANANYTGTINGKDFSFPNGSSTNTTTIAGLLKDYLKTLPAFRAGFRFSSATNVVTITTATKNLSNPTFTCATSDAKLTFTNTVDASAPAVINFAEPMFACDGSTSTGVTKAKPLSASTFTKKVITIVIAYTSGATVQLNFKYGNKVLPCGTVMATDLATSRAALKSSIEAVADDTVVTVANSSTNALTLTAVNYGVDFDIDGIGCTSITHTTDGSDVSASDLFLGIVKRQDTAFASDTAAGFNAGEVFEIQTSKRICVNYSGTAGRAGDRVMYDYTNKVFKKFTGEGAALPAGCVLLDKLKLIAVHSSGSLAIVEM